MNTAIDVRSVTRTYGRTTALDDVSFAVPAGSVCGLLGRNGAGKTTIMSILAGQDRPTSGAVEVLGHAPFEHASTLAAISFVRDNQRYPDDYRLHHVLRIAVAFAPNWSGELAAELAEGFRIPTRTPLKKLSRGQLTSVGVVLSLASRAPITLLDEPYLGLDVTARKYFNDVLLRDLADTPRTVLLSTHLIEESEALFDRVLIIDGGRIVVDCDRDDAYDLAAVVSGTTSAVERVVGDRPVLASHAVGGLVSATVRGAVDDGFRTAARDHNVQVAPATLPQLVDAFGSDAEQTQTTEERKAA